MIYVLMIVSLASYGTTTAMQEFDSLAACESARSIHVRLMDGWQFKPRTACVSKGETR